MFTSVDKAIVAIIMAVLFIITAWWGDGWWSHLTEEWVVTVLAILTPLFVWLFPNREA